MQDEWRGISGFQNYEISILCICSTIIGIVLGFVLGRWG